MTPLLAWQRPPGAAGCCDFCFFIPWPSDVKELSPQMSTPSSSFSDCDHQEKVIDPMEPLPSSSKPQAYGSPSSHYSSPPSDRRAQPGPLLPATTVVLTASSSPSMSRTEHVRRRRGDGGESRRVAVVSVAAPRAPGPGILQERAAMDAGRTGPKGREGKEGIFLFLSFEDLDGSDVRTAQLPRIKCSSD